MQIQGKLLYPKSIREVYSVDKYKSKSPVKKQTLKKFVKNLSPRPGKTPKNETLMNIKDSFQDLGVESKYSRNKKP